VVQDDPQSNPPSVDNLFSADPYANRFLHTGREFLKEANLYDYRNRVYSAELGRFLQTDPIRFEAGDGNLYRYVANNPVNLIDPTGEIAFVPILVGIGIGMAIDWAYDEFAADHVNDFINDNFDCDTQANLRTAGNVFDVARSIKNPVRGANNIRKQVFKMFPTRKKAKDAAAHSPGGPWQKDWKTMGPEKHGDTPPHYHDGHHDHPTKPNTHYQFPDSQY
jgi:RHS repeat-associated protein